MKKLLLTITALLIAFTSYEIGQAKGAVKGAHIAQAKTYTKANEITERVITRVTDNRVDEYGNIEVTNIHNPHDVIMIEAIPGIKLGKGVQVDFTHDTVTHTKELNYFPYKN